MAAKSSSAGKPRRSHPAVTAVFAAVLLALGTLTFRFGLAAIVHGYFEYPNRRGSNITIGSLGFDDPASDFRILPGPEAMYWGLAFCALGVMFGLWGLGMLLATFSRKKQPPEPSALGRLNTWLSFVALLVAILCLFPPWRLGSALFYGASVLLIGSVVYSVRSNRPSLPKKVVPGLIVVAILASNFQLTSLSAGIALATFASLFIGVHVLLLAPHLMKRRPDEKEPEPSLSFDD